MEEEVRVETASTRRVRIVLLRPTCRSWEPTALPTRRAEDQNLILFVLPLLSAAPQRPKVSTLRLLFELCPPKLLRRLTISVSTLPPLPRLFLSTFQLLRYDWIDPGLRRLEVGRGEERRADEKGPPKCREGRTESREEVGSPRRDGRGEEEEAEQGRKSCDDGDDGRKRKMLREEKGFGSSPVDERRMELTEEEEVAGRARRRRC